MMRSLCAAWKMAKKFAPSTPTNAAIAQERCDITSVLPCRMFSPFGERHQQQRGGPEQQDDRHLSHTPPASH